MAEDCIDCQSDYVYLGRVFLHVKMLNVVTLMLNFST
jgi:hypothetical protein